jgi:hypothetical protein
VAQEAISKRTARSGIILFLIMILILIKHKLKGIVVSEETKSSIPPRMARRFTRR